MRAAAGVDLGARHPPLLQLGARIAPGAPAARAAFPASVARPHTPITPPRARTPTWHWHVRVPCGCRLPSTLVAGLVRAIALASTDEPRLYRGLRLELRTPMCASRCGGSAVGSEGAARVVGPLMSVCGGVHSRGHPRSSRLGWARL